MLIFCYNIGINTIRKIKEMEKLLRQLQRNHGEQMISLMQEINKLNNGQRFSFKTAMKTLADLETLVSKFETTLTNCETVKRCGDYSAVIFPMFKEMKNTVSTLIPRVEECKNEKDSYKGKIIFYGVFSDLTETAQNYKAWNYDFWNETLRKLGYETPEVGQKEDPLDF